MSFGNFPDEDKLRQSIDRVRDIFANAAAQNTSAQVLFERLSNKFSQVLDDALEASTSGADPQKALMKLMPAIMDVQLTITMIKKKAETDPAVGQVLAQIEQDMREEAKNILGGVDLGALGGLAGGLRRPTPPPANKNPAPPPAAPQDKKKPQPPKSGDHKF